MELYTPIPIDRAAYSIGAWTPLLLLGSCFSDNVGGKLLDDGFEAIVNPTGPLYNPLSLAHMLERCITGKMPGPEDFIQGPRGWHSLEYASRYSGPDAEALAARISQDLAPVCRFLEGSEPRMAVFTFGTSYVFHLATTGMPVGNCHKFHPATFERRLRSADDFVARWKPLVVWMRDRNIHPVFTVSPIRHMADGAHGNTISKATLHMAVERLVQTGADYFPAYEIMMDQLRDYRFYARDMVHPSDLAVDIIYRQFLDTYLAPSSVGEVKARAAQLRSEAQRHILS